MMKDPLGTRKSFDLQTVHDLLEKLRWEINMLRERMPWDGWAATYHAFNCAVTAWHTVDWIYESLTEAIKEKILTEFGISIPKKADLDEYVFASCRDLHLCRLIATGSKHRRVHVHNDEEVVSDVSIGPVFMIQTFDGRSVPDVPTRYEPKIVDGDSRHAAIEVFERAHLFLKMLVDAWKVEPKEVFVPSDDVEFEL